MCNKCGKHIHKHLTKLPSSRLYIPLSLCIHTSAMLCWRKGSSEKRRTKKIKSTALTKSHCKLWNKTSTSLHLLGICLLWKLPCYTSLSWNNKRWKQKDIQSQWLYSSYWFLLKVEPKSIYCFEFCPSIRQKRNKWPWKVQQQWYEALVWLSCMKDAITRAYEEGNNMVVVIYGPEKLQLILYARFVSHQPSNG